MRWTRALLTLAGVALGLWGALLATRENGHQITQVLEWAAVAVILHDGVLAPITLGLGWIGSRLLPAAVASVATVFVVLGGTLTLLAIPVLVRHGAASKNPTLLDRNYVGGWLSLLVVVVLAVVTGRLVAGEIARRKSHGAGHGGG